MKSCPKKYFRIVFIDLRKGSKCQVEASTHWGKSRFIKILLTEIHATNTNAAFNISEGIIVASGLFEKKLYVHKNDYDTQTLHFHGHGRIFNAERSMI